ncbi:hypothetical protein LCGC14_1546340 [marine sediment metagenome]|uniref:Uncharacterized protein n=1 Tax=marine sediment metagenome TaxID=412755 RepID=A0A0F9LSE0_9ZZZZ
MATSDYSRSIEKDIIIKEDRLFNAIFEFGRDDDAAVDFGDDTILMKIWNKQGGTLRDTLTSGTEFTVSVARLTFNKTFTNLLNRAYYYEIYNDTLKVGIRHGLFIVL